MRQGHSILGKIAKLSRPWRPPRCREYHQSWLPHHTHNTRGNMAMADSLNYYPGAGPAKATELPPHRQGGAGAASQVLAQVHLTLDEGLTRTHTCGCTGPVPMDATQPEDPSVAYTCGTGEPCKNCNAPLTHIMHIHIDPHPFPCDPPSPLCFSGRAGESSP